MPAPKKAVRKKAPKKTTPVAPARAPEPDPVDAGPEPVDPAAAPRSREALRAWLAGHLELHFPDRALIPGHASPLDYLEHSFLGDLCEEPAPAIADCVVWANRGGGKTFLGAVATALDLLFKPGIEVRILAGSLEQAGKMHRYLRRIFDRPALGAHLRGRIGERHIVLRNGSRAELLAQSHESVRGTRVQKLRCDEVELFGDDIWEAAQLTTRTATCGPWRIRSAIECFSTMHRGYGLMSRLVAECAAGKRTLFRWGVLDVLGECPPARLCETCVLHQECRGRAKLRPGRAGHLSIDDAIQQKSRVALPTWEAEMLSLRPQRTDCVFAEFDRGRHTFEAEAPAGGVWLAGMDFGYRAPTVILWAHLDESGTLRIMREHVLAEAILQRHIEAILNPAHPRPAWIAIDQAGRARNEHTGKSSAEIMREAGLDVRSSPQAVRDGVLLIRARLAPASRGPARLLIHRRCAHLIKSMEEYHYDPAKPESDEPLKDGVHDHACDALRYLVYALERPRNLSITNHLAP